jgi:hypothetical protein
MITVWTHFVATVSAAEQGIPNEQEFKALWHKICRLRATLMIEKEIFDGGLKLQKVPKIKDSKEDKPVGGQSRSCCGTCRGTVYPEDYAMMSTPRLSAQNGEASHGRVCH